LTKPFFLNKSDIKPPKRFIFTQPGIYSVFSFNFGLLIIKLKIRGFPVVCTSTQNSVFMLIQHFDSDSASLFSQCWNFKQSMGTRNRVGIGLSYRPARLHSPGRIGSLESILGLLKSLKIRALAGRYNNPIPTRFLAPIDCFKIPAQELFSCICIVTIFCHCKLRFLFDFVVFVTWKIWPEELVLIFNW
jgi:hypothetical protein